MALYQELPVFRDVYRLTLRVHQLTQSFSREFKFTLGQDMLYKDDSGLQYWLSRDPAERIAAVEIIRQRVFGGTDETRQGLQRVCRIIRR